MKAIGNRLVVTMAATTILLFVVVGLLLGWQQATNAAEPGSKDDPLATVGYVERFAEYNRVVLPGGQSLRVGIGTEFIVVDGPSATISTSEFKPLHDDLIDLTAGSQVLTEQINLYHHYFNASGHDIFLKFAGETTLFVRGSWK